MKPLTVPLLVELMPESEEVAPFFVEHLTASCVRYEIDTPRRISFFLAQVAHESVRLTVLSETLNYSVKGLLRVHPTFFTQEQAQNYSHQPARIANRIYAGRYGNGDEASGDGWRFRGRGLFPNVLMGQAMYRRCSMHIFDNPYRLVAEPWLLSTPKWAAMSAGWVWWDIGGNQFADEGDEHSFRKITRKINRGVQGIQDRQDLLARCRKILNCAQSVATADESPSEGR